MFIPIRKSFPLLTNNVFIISVFPINTNCISTAIRNFHISGIFLKKNNSLRQLHGRFYLLRQNRQINIAGNQSKPIRSTKHDRPRSAAGYLFALLPIATFCLGTWQIYRLQWKLDLIAKLESIINNDPIDFPDEFDSINEMEYVKVKVRGYFDHSSEPQFIFPRSLITRENMNTPGSLLTGTSKGSSQGLGAQLVLPFVITDPRFEQFNSKPLKILVNLGWIPRETMDKINQIKSRKQYESQNNHYLNNNKPEIMELIGVIRKTEKREPFTPKQEFTQGYWTRRDIEKLSEKLQTLPIFLDAFDSYPIKLSFGNNLVEINPIGGQTRVNLRNEHLSYIITWYSLTGIFSYLWYKKIFRSRL